MSKTKQKELNENELAAWLNKANTSIEPYSKPIAAVVGLLIVGLIAWGLYSGKAAGDRSDATLQLLMSDPEVADRYPETAAAAWSTLYSANSDLEAGIQALYTNREDAETLLTQAKETFNTAVDSSDDVLLRSRAYLGIALASESLGQLDEAIEAYKNCIDVNESEAMVSKAQARIDELTNPDTQEFVAWFGEQDFAPADPSLPPELPGDVTLPELPDLKLSPLLSDEKDGEKGDDEMKLDDLPSDLDLPADGDQGAKSDGDAKADDSADKKEGLELPTTDKPEKKE